MVIPFEVLVCIVLGLVCKLLSVRVRTQPKLYIGHTNVPL